MIRRSSGLKMKGRSKSEIQKGFGEGGSTRLPGRVLETVAGIVNGEVQKCQI